MRIVQHSLIVVLMAIAPACYRGKQTNTAPKPQPQPVEARTSPSLEDPDSGPPTSNQPTPSNLPEPNAPTSPTAPTDTQNPTSPGLPDSSPTP